jgi:hypothetical protein
MPFDIKRSKFLAGVQQFRINVRINAYFYTVEERSQIMYNFESYINSSYII